MPLPVEVQTVTVNFGPFTDFLGAALKGETIFKPSTAVKTATGVPLIAAPLRVVWDVTGSGSITLPASDSTGLDRTGFTYDVAHRPHGTGVPAPRGGSISLPAAAPVVDLEDLVDTEVSPGVVIAQPAVVSIAGLTGAPTSQQVADALAPALRAAYVSLVQPSGDTTGAADKAALNAALATGGRVRGKAGSTFYINGPLVAPSNTELDMTGCTVMLATGNPGHMLRSAAEHTPTASASDGAITSGSNVLTTALGAQAVVGQLVTVAGASTGGLQAICGVVSAKTSTTITLVDFLSRPLNAGTTVSAAAVTLRTPTTNVRLIGGTWNRQDNGGTGTGYHCLSLRYVDGLHMSGQRYTATQGKYAVSLAGTRNFVIEDQTGLGTNSDGVHIDGPAIAGVVRDVFGTFGDDMVAVTPMDWSQFGDICGDVTDLLIENVYSSGTARAVVKVLGGQHGDARRITVRNVAGTCTTDAAAVWIGDDTDQPETVGYVDDITVENLAVRLTNNAARQLAINGKNMGRIVIDGVTLDNGSSTTQRIHVGPSSPGTIDSLTLANIKIRALGTSEPWAVLINGSCTIRKLICRDWDCTATTGYAGINISGGTVDDLAWDGFTGRFQAPGNGLGAPVYLALGQASVLRRAALSNFRLTGAGSGAGFVQAPGSNQTVTELLVSQSTITSVAWLFALATVTAVKLSEVATYTPGAGIGYAYASGVVTVDGAGNNLAAGGQNWQVEAGGKIAVRVADAPPSTNTGARPTIAAGAGAGTSPTVAITGTDRAGTITVTPGTGPAAGVQATVTFIGTWPQTPKVTLTPTNAAAQAGGGYVSAKSTTTFAVSSATTPGGSMTFDYTVAA